MDPSISTAALHATEAALRKALVYDPASCQALEGLQGRVLALQLTPLEMTLYVHPGEGGLALTNQWEGEVHSRLSGKLWDFIRLAQGEQASLAGSGIRLEGDAQLVQSLQRIMRQLDIDWEEALCAPLGDLTGHQLAQALRSGSLWCKGREAEARRLLTDFIGQELALVPSRAELEDFYHQVDELQLHLDRVEARLQQRRTTASPPHKQAHCKASNHPEDSV